MLTVLAASPNRDLVSLNAVKSDLGIVTLTDDAKIRAMISAASAIIEEYCGRTFAIDNVEQIFYMPDATISLARYPVTDIESVVVDGVELTPAEYMCDMEAGLLYRMLNGRRVAWNADHVTVIYDTGFCTIPKAVERATIDLVSLLRSKSSRDPLVRSIDIPDVVQESYWVGGTPGDGLPSDIRIALARYRVRRLAAA